MSPSWPRVDGLARQHLAAGAVLGRRVHVDVPADAATEHVLALFARRIFGHAAGPSTTPSAASASSTIASGIVVPILR